MAVSKYNIKDVIDYIGEYLKTNLNDRLTKVFTYTNNKVIESKTANININYKDTDISGFNPQSSDLMANGFHYLEIIYEDYGVLPNFVNEIPTANIVIEVFLRTMNFTLNDLRYSVQDVEIFSSDLFNSDAEKVEQVEDDNDTFGNCAKYKKSYKLKLKFNK